jgi:hypothetical protein
MDQVPQARSRLTRATVGAAAALLLVAACTGPQAKTPRTSPEPPRAVRVGPIPDVRPGGAPTLAAAIARLCVPPSVPGGTPASGTLPPELDAIARQVELARGHTYTTPPAAEAITDREMDRRLSESFAAYYPKEQYDRRTVAWRTIGVIGPRDDLYRAYRTFFKGQVVGFYDPETSELVYLGSGDLGFSERFTLAHELTHALDDQVFDLTRLDRLTATCRDERGEAALGLVEGSAQYFAAVTVAQDPQMDLSNLLETIAESLRTQPAPAGVPPFVDALETWPYLDGEGFVATLAAGGGTDAVDAAFRRFPRSTEQVIHADRFPSDRPRAVSIPNLTRELGPGWGDLDAMTVGEAWLRAMLALRLDEERAADAAAGWDGGGYRAFTDGKHVLVVLRTAWDDAGEARAFAGALTTWSAGSRLVRVDANGSTVTVAFADTPEPLPAARSLQQ